MRNERHSDISKIIGELRVLGDQQKAKLEQRFFKTGDGQYSQHDIFWGVTVPQVRKIAHAYKQLEVAQLAQLLEHEVHEVRLCALLILVAQAKHAPELMYNLYLKKINCVNNWDLVDLSAPIIVGDYLLNNDCAILYKLAQSESLWERRIAIVATYAFIKTGLPEHTLKIAQILLHDKQDLIQKAAGWMLREVGKRCSRDILEAFLEKHAAVMPRTMLRYALEHFEPEKKNYFMRAKSLYRG